MNFDFYNQFKDYSTTDLLKIIQRPNEYQADAVKAATQIINEREVTQEEIEQVKTYYNEIDSNEKSKADKINSYKDKAADFFEPVMKPGMTIKPDRWLNILLLTIALQYVWTLIIYINDISKFIKIVIDCKSYGFDNYLRQPVSYWTCFKNQLSINIFDEFFALIYIPVIFYLLYKRRRWGWMLLFADNLFSFISTISQSYLFFKYQQFHHGDTASFITHILIKGLFVIFLWKDCVSDFFGVTKKAKQDMVLITSIITIAFIIGIQIFV